MKADEAKRLKELLAELPDDLLGCMPLPFHREVLLPSMLDVGLSQQADHYPGVPS